MFYMWRLREVEDEARRTILDLDRDLDIQYSISYLLAYHLTCCDARQSRPLISLAREPRASCDSAAETEGELNWGI